jgi:hypothetical protein
LASLINGLEEPANADGSTEVVLESLKGLAVLLSVETKKPISPRIVFALKPFVEKENWEMRLAAINALRATAQGWQRFVQSPDDDVTDHLLGCIPCLVIKLEDGNEAVATVTSFPFPFLMSIDFTWSLHLPSIQSEQFIARAARVTGFTLKERRVKPIQLINVLLMTAALKV